MIRKGGPAHTCILSFFLDITAKPPKSSTCLVGIFFKPCFINQLHMSNSFSDFAFLASLSLAMQLHHLHSLPCYKAHPGTKDLQIFRVFPSHQAATAQGIIGLPKLLEATSFNSIQYNSTFFLDQSKRNNRIPLKLIWQLYAFVLLSNFFFTNFYGKAATLRNATGRTLFESDSWPDPLAVTYPIKYIVLGQFLKMTEKHPSPTPNKKNAVIFALTKRLFQASSSNNHNS